MKYNQQLNYQRRKRFLFRVRMFFVLLVGCIIIAGAYGYYLVVIQEQANTQATSTSQQASSYFAPSTKIFRSPYFQFQADKTWTEVTTESTPSKFVYRSLRANLIEHDLTIYVDNIPPMLASNRVLPVNPKGESEFLPTSVSEHCMKTAGGSRIDDPLITLDKVKFRCDADSTNYSVLAGLIGGSSMLNLKRPDGSNANYAIVYSNLRALSESSQFQGILASFQTR